MFIRRSIIFALTTLIIAVAPFWSCAQGIITTVAGNGRVFQDNGGSATSAGLGLVYGVAVDSAGNVYATDADDNLVVKISPSGTLTVVAGNNIAGFSGDGGPATSASLSLSSGRLAVDSAGNLYISDQLNCLIRKVSTNGTIATIAGTGNCKFAGDGGPATSASFWDPSGLAIDSAGNLYIADASNNRIRKITPSGLTSTVAGNGSPGFSGDGGPATSASLNFPTGVAVDGAGNIYIADADNNLIRKVSTGGTIQTVAGNGVAGNSGAGDGGPATSAPLNAPHAIAVDSTGNLYITANVRVRKVTPDGTINTFAGNGNIGVSGDGGPATSAALNFPDGLAVDAIGDVFIADTSNARVRKVGLDGTITTVAGTSLANFSGDGGSATTASLSDPSGVAVDGAGNLYIADFFNNRIRKVSPLGIITTVAGNGVAGASGDGGSAVSASLNAPEGVAVDSTGNIYIADFDNDLVRKVNSAGIITTLVGTGVTGFSGDGGQATRSQLNSPADVVLDAAGNLYIADSGNNRIRKVTPDGTISTVAGSGPTGASTGGFSGDGGPATRALLNNPTGVAVDAAGTLYIADTGNDRIRKVNTDGIISTVAGGGSNPNWLNGDPATTAKLYYPTGIAVDLAGNLYIGETNAAEIDKVGPDGKIRLLAGTEIFSFSGDGGPAADADLNAPEGVAVDTAGNVFIADTINDRIRKVLVTPPSFSVAPASMTFTAPSGAAQIAPQQVTVSSAVAGLGWTASSSTNSGGGWLAVSPASGSVPGLINISANAAGLAAGTYSGTVTITAPNAVPAFQTVAVTFNVTAATPARLGVAPNALSFSFKSGSPVTSTVLRVENEGGGSLDFTASASTTSGGGWLAVAPTSGTATQTTTVPLSVTANPASLNAGTYTGQVLVVSTTTGEQTAVSVTMTISAVQQTILLSQTGLTFTAVASGGSAPPQTFGILNVGQGVMSWSASATTLSGGSSWLTVTPNSGTADASSLQAALVQVAVNPAGLAPGSYYGQVQVSASGAGNSPQFALVTLNVLPAGTNPAPVVQPTGLIFTGAAGATSPGSQDLVISNLSGSSVSLASGHLTFDGGNWFDSLPLTATVAPNQPLRVTVQPNSSGLGPGIRRGVLTLAFQFSDNTVQSVPVNLLFVLTPGTAGAVREGLMPAAAGCTPTQLLPVFTSLPTNFSGQNGWPNPIQVRVIDDCGNPMTTGSVLATVSTGDQIPPLTHLGGGLWSGTWLARNSTSAPVTITVLAQIPSQNLQGTVQVSGSLAPSQNSPLVNAGGVVSGAAFVSQVPVAPGSIVSIFGSKLATSLALASQLPLGTQLSDSQVSIGGRPMPLFYTSDGQINAMVPYGIATNTQYQVFVQRGSTLSSGEAVTVAASQPAVFTQDQSGKGQGLIFVGNPLPDGSNLASASNPAKSGDTIVIYCSGLGEVSPPVASGAAAPSSPPATTVNQVTVTIGGVQAQVAFAGLAPTFAGLYQVNAVVPPGVAPGSQVPVTLSVAGQTSPAVTMAVQ